MSKLTKEQVKLIKRRYDTVKVGFERPLIVKETESYLTIGFKWTLFSKVFIVSISPFILITYMVIGLFKGFIEGVSEISGPFDDGRTSARTQMKK